MDFFDLLIDVCQKKAHLLPRCDAEKGSGKSSLMILLQGKADIDRQRSFVPVNEFSRYFDIHNENLLRGKSLSMIIHPQLPVCISDMNKD